ncbi:MAG: UTP--glucose-1-phosphate uridylyltransferase GalU [Actinomycetota bacterium]|nr:UTP--glucose-1-phosphate uridylyltransferase GalU [Actinomycetota bacterium]
MKKIRKAVIPAAGLGTRFLPATKAQPKEMLPVVDKPAIQYVVEEALASGLDDILVVTGRSKRSIEDHFDRSFELEYYLEQAKKDEELALVKAVGSMAQIHYVRQGDPRGLGHAVAAARAHVGNDPFAVLLADDISDGTSTLLPQMLEQFYRHGRTVIALQEVDESQIQLYGCVKPEPVTENLVRISEIVEKPQPQEAPSNLAVTGRYLFTPEIFDALDKTSPGVSGEIQLTDAIQLLLSWQAAYGLITADRRYDIGNKVDYLRATVEIALGRSDLGTPLREFLAEVVARDSELRAMCKRNGLTD